MYYIHHNKCQGGYAIKETRPDGESRTFCWGRIDMQTENTSDKCKVCPKHVDRVDEWWEGAKHEFSDELS